MFHLLSYFIDNLKQMLFHLDPTSHFAKALDFFIYDSIKIITLLILIIFLMGFVNSYFPVERVKNYLTTHKFFGLDYLMASLFGVVTPFCSCSSVPLFIGFVRGGIPLGVTYAFLITSPLVNEVAIGLFLGLFGIKITTIYIVSGILLGTISGFILQHLKLDNLLTPWAKEVLMTSNKNTNIKNEEQISFIQKLPVIYNDTIKILKGVILYVLIGIAIGGMMHGYVPEGFFEQYMNKSNVFAVPIATVLAVPMYSNASGILPVVQVLVSKGIPLGTAISFMMGVVALSLPEAMLLKKIMSIKLIIIFFIVVTLCIIISGYLFNIIL
ncbi:permease [Thalassobellus sediminis]|uniref:permease n=1 Tax=Thalassobellus sediminis TaxID=3367753 RepID=UPI0037A08A09